MNTSRKYVEKNIWVIHQNNLDGFAAASIFMASIYSDETKKHIRVIPIAIDDNINLVECLKRVRARDSMYLLGHEIKVSDANVIDRIFTLYGDSVSVTIIDHHDDSIKVAKNSNSINHYLKKSGGIYPVKDFGSSTSMLVYILSKMGIIFPYDNMAYSRKYREYFMPNEINYAFQSYYFKDCEHPIDLEIIRSAFDELCDDAFELLKVINTFTLSHDKNDDRTFQGYSELVGIYSDGLYHTFLDTKNENSVLNLLIKRNQAIPNSDELISNTHPVFHRNQQLDRLKIDLSCKGAEILETINTIQKN